MKRCAHCKKQSPKFKCGANSMCPHYYCNQKCGDAQWKTHAKFCKSFLLIAGEDKKRLREDEDTINIIGQNNFTIKVSRATAIGMSATIAAWNSFTQSSSDTYQLDMEFMDMNVLLDLQYFLENRGEMRPLPFVRSRTFYIEFSNLLHFLQVDDNLIPLSNVFSSVKRRPDFSLFDMPEQEKEIQKSLWEKCSIEYYTKSLDRFSVPNIDIDKYISIEHYGAFDELNAALCKKLYDDSLISQKRDIFFSSPYFLYVLIEAPRKTPRDVWFLLNLIVLYIPDALLWNYILDNEGIIVRDPKERYYFDANPLPHTAQEVLQQLSKQIHYVMVGGFEFQAYPDTHSIRVAQLFMLTPDNWTSINCPPPYYDSLELKADFKKWVNMFGIEIVEYFVPKEKAWSFILEIERNK